MLGCKKVSGAPHTVTFPSDLGGEAQVVCEGAGGTDTPAVPGHTPPQGPGDFSCPAGSNLEVEFGGGNGVSTISSPTTVSDSGLLSTPQFVNAFGGPATASLHSWSVRFAPGAPAGTYHYVCQIHEGMAGVVIVGS